MVFTACDIMNSGYRVAVRSSVRDGGKKSFIKSNCVIFSEVQQRRCLSLSCRLRSVSVMTSSTMHKATDSPQLVRYFANSSQSPTAGVLLFSVFFVLGTLARSISR